jgi:hypothetical protein
MQEFRRELDFPHRPDTVAMVSSATQLADDPVLIPMDADEAPPVVQRLASSNLWRLVAICTLI